MTKELLGRGYGVTILGRAGMRYREDDRSVFINSEMLTGGYDFVVYVKSLRTWEDTSEPISDEDRNRIVANVETVLHKNGITVLFES